MSIVITIIVLLILAGITISTLIGENGILTRTKNAKETTEESNDVEQVRLAVTYGKTQNIIDGSDINSEIEKELKRTDENATVTGDGNEKTINYNNKLYIVNIKDGNIEPTTEEELAERKLMKTQVLIGEDGKVVLPIPVEAINGTVDWGDGTISAYPKETSFKQNKEAIKIASISNIKVAAGLPSLVAIPSVTHQYTEDYKGKEISIKINGNVEIIFANGTAYSSGYGNYTADENGNYYDINNQLFVISQWGELGYKQIGLYGLSNLIEIGSTTEKSFENLEIFNINTCGISKIPENLFINCPKITSFNTGFAYNSNLKELPDRLFENCKNVTSFVCTFKGCSNLKEIPENLFANCKNATDFRSVFDECSSIEKIPENLFKDCINVTSFERAFCNCDKLTEIPERLFENCKKVISFDGTFSYCSNLETIYEKLFQNCQEVTTYNTNATQGGFSMVFFGCTNLKSIPEKLFYNCTKSKGFYKAFSYCSSLTEIPENLFSKNIDVKNFYGVFEECTNLIGNAPDLWNTNSGATGTKCFYGCTNLTNYSEIPDGWK